MSAFEIVPFIGALPLKFGMRPEEVRSCLGEAKAGKGGTRWYYPELRMNVGFDGLDGTVDHVGFGKGARVRFQQLDFFEDREAWKALLKQSEDYHTVLGFLVFCDIGIAMGGFHDGDEAQLSVTVFPKGAWEKFRQRFAPLELT